MNEFTKEELEDLYYCCGGSVYDDHPLEDWKEALRIKIQSMINNYCQHEWLTVGFYKASPEIESVVMKRCKKCEEYSIDE
jgi:hypothetical protein